MTEGHRIFTVSFCIAFFRKGFYEKTISVPAEYATEAEAVAMVGAGSDHPRTVRTGRGAGCGEVRVVFPGGDGCFGSIPVRPTGGTVGAGLLKLCRSLLLVGATILRMEGEKINGEKTKSHTRPHRAESVRGERSHNGRRR